MWENIKLWFDENREYGLTLWYAYDPISQKPSVTLFMAYISFILACASLIALQFALVSVVATGMAFVFNVLMVVFYLIRTLNKAKIDIENKSLELEGGDPKNEETK